MELKDQIRIAREAKGWEPEELAARMGVSKTSVIHWESGKGIRLERLKLLEDVLGVSLSATGASKLEGVVKEEHIALAVALASLPREQFDAIAKLIEIGLNPRTKIKPFMETHAASKKIAAFIREFDADGKEIKAKDTPSATAKGNRKGAV
jgi:transcriptional regulator with XRE-family HTH domain